MCAWRRRRRWSLPLDLGRAHSNSNLFGGLLDEVAVYPSALSTTRIQAHYDKATTAKEPFRRG